MADWAWKWCQISWPRMAKRDDKSHKEDHSHIPSPASLISPREISRCVISLAWGVGLYFPLVKEILCSNTLPRFWTGRPGQWPLVLFIFYPSFYFLFAHNSHARFWYSASHFQLLFSQWFIVWNLFFPLLFQALGVIWTESFFLQQRMWPVHGVNYVFNGCI
jgi:hypothetical protein